jgi:arylsulfatase
MGTVKGVDGKDIKVPAKYYGQIAKIDENLGRLNEFLEKTGLKDNTILVYSSDNGARSVEATKIYNAGMSGHKTELVEGGHRVPCFIRWPKSDIKPARDVSELTTVQDIAPTLLDLCGITPPNLYPMDGVTLSPLLRGDPWQHGNRNIAIQYTADGGPWKSAVVMSGKWRLISGKNLFNIADDPAQKSNVAKENPEVFNALNAFYNDWHKQASVEFQKPRYIHLGNAKSPEVILYANDWKGDYCDNRATLLQGKANGAWDVVIDTPGNYQVEISRWPFESGKKLVEGNISNSNSSEGALPVAKAQLIIGEANQTIETAPDDKTARFTLPLQAGKTTVTANLLDKDGKTICGAMYVKATLVK